MAFRTPLLTLCSFMGLLQLALALASGSHSSTQTHNIPGEFQNATSHAEFIASAAGPDAPKIHPVNASAFDWWYFDVVSTDPTSLASVVIVLYTTTPEAFPYGGPPGPVVAQISGSFPNGTLYSAITDGESATVTTGHDASSAGVWHNTGFSWSSPRPSEYFITIDAPQMGVKGTIQFKSVGHILHTEYYIINDELNTFIISDRTGTLPCGPIAVGQDMQVAPHIGWANAVPDSMATVRLTVGGTKLSFSGAGYHDKNWSDQLFSTNVDSWYWGHGRVGPYSFVWFDFLGLDGLEYVSAYVAKAGKIVVASCGAESIRVRPVGRNSTYPPTISSERPEGYHITLDLPGDGVLEIDVAVSVPLVEGVPIYARSVGRTSGYLTSAGEGAKSLAAGVALFEQFTMTL